MSLETVKAASDSVRCWLRLTWTWSCCCSLVYTVNMLTHCAGAWSVIHHSMLLFSSGVIIMKDGDHLIWFRGDYLCRCYGPSSTRSCYRADRCRLSVVLINT